MAPASPRLRVDEEVRAAPVWNTTTETARWIDVHRNTLKRIPTSELPFRRVGSRGDRRYHIDDIVAYIERTTVR
jgi:hypothetical protein